MADWSPVCSDQIENLEGFLDEIRATGAEVIGISVDGVWCHRAFAQERHITFSLLADSEPKGGVASSYGVYDADHGLARRALFVVDAEGIVRWSECYPATLSPGVSGILDALRS
jgi:peroxiredoxin